MGFILRTIGIFIAVAVAVWIVPGVSIISSGASWASILIIALIIALLNMSVKPILQVLGLPITILSLGVFYLVINTLLLYLAAWLANSLFGAGFYIADFGSGFLASIVISLVSTLINGLTGASETD